MTAVLCPLCLTRPAAFAPGPGGRPGARCGSCQALERHRFLGALLTALAPEHAHAHIVLEVAPTPSISRTLRRRGAVYVGMDLAPAADGRTVQLVADLRRMPLVPGSVDLAVVFHVLEHVPDDAAAIAELARILAGDGLALVQVPWRPDRPTDEDPSAPTAERIRRFGQADHVRFYGADLDDRLHAGGLHTAAVRPGDVVPSDLVDTLGLTDATPVWLAWSGSGPAAFRQEEPAAVIRSRLEAEAVAEWRRLRTLPPATIPYPAWVGRLARTRVGRAVRRLTP